MPRSRYRRRRRKGFNVFRLPRQLRFTIFLALCALVIFGGIKLFGWLGGLIFGSGDTPAPVSVQMENTPQPVETAAPTMEPTTEPGPTVEPEPTMVAPISVDNAQAPEETEGVRTATIRAVGDIIMHDPLLATAKNDETRKYDFSQYFSLISETMGKADYTVANVEAPMGGKGTRGYKGYPQFNTPAVLIDNLLSCGVDMLTLANNHALDTYYDGLKATLDNLDKKGMAHVGAYRSQEEYDTPEIIEVNGIKIGVLNYTTGTNGLERVSDAEAQEYGLRYTGSADYQKDADDARAAGAEVLVAFMHWGEEYERNPSRGQKSIAKQLAKAGVDVIVGGHPHMTQPITYITVTDDSGQEHRTLCLYSMGNFLSDQRAQYRDSGVVFEFTFQDNPETGRVELASSRYVPTYVWRTGSDQEGYDYRVLAIGDWLKGAPDGMSDEDYARMLEAWNEIILQLGQDISGVALT